jgi:hypothetical protein
LRERLHTRYGRKGLLMGWCPAAARHTCSAVATDSITGWNAVREPTHQQNAFFGYQIQTETCGGRSPNPSLAHGSSILTEGLSRSAVVYAHCARNRARHHVTTMPEPLLRRLSRQRLVHDEVVPLSKWAAAHRPPGLASATRRPATNSNLGLRRPTVGRWRYQTSPTAVR